MTTDPKRKNYGGWAVLALGLLFVAPAHADVLSEMNNFWRGVAVNTTGPTAFQGQASGHWTLGNLYLRAPVRSEQIATVNMPSFRAGCGGIDAFAGAFSFINSDQLIAFGRAVAQNAAGFAFELALETISPVIAETMAKLRALAQWVNDRNLNSCETAQALVGAVWSKNDRASASICAAIGTSQGIFSDYAAAKHGCGSEGKRNSTLASASGAMADQVPVNVNYAWKAVKSVIVPVGRHAIGGVRHVGLRHGDRHRADLRRGQFRSAGPRPGAAGARPPRHGNPHGRRRRPAGLPLRHQ